MLSSGRLPSSHAVICLCPFTTQGLKLDALSLAHTLLESHPPVRLSSFLTPFTPPLIPPQLSSATYRPCLPRSPHASALVEQEVLNPYLPPLVPLITTCVEDDWYKIIAEALRVVGVVITIIRPIDKASGMFKGVRSPSLLRPMGQRSDTTHGSVSLGMGVVKPTSP